MAKKILHWIDEHIENVLIFPMYFVMMAIMAIGVVQRFVFKTAFHWAVYVCIALFVWFTWLGCSWNVKERAHLRLSAFRNKMPRNVQFGLLMLDYTLWIAFGIIAAYCSVLQILRLQDVGALIYGTETIPQWLVPLCIPVSFSVLFIRVIQCAKQDIKDFRNNEPLKLNPTTTIE
ncbi:MAG: TRAP transporter small permease subunit [Deltaproteobacteria bacterium]|nr:TRAP transporter small permease subunit [Deltaproteobacteria bacterium]